jgi:hypothetical protein
VEEQLRFDAWAGLMDRLMLDWGLQAEQAAPVGGAYECAIEGTTVDLEWGVAPTPRR